VRRANLPPSCAVVAKSGNLNFPEPSGPLQACNGTDLRFITVVNKVARNGFLYFLRMTIQVVWLLPSVFYSRTRWQPSRVEHVALRKGKCLCNNKRVVALTKTVFMIQLVQRGAMSSANTTSVFVRRDLRVSVAACGTWISQDVDRYSTQAVNYTARDNEYQVEGETTRHELRISHSNDTTACWKYRFVLIIRTNTPVLVDRHIHISSPGSDLPRYEAASLAKWCWTFLRDLPPSSLRVQGQTSNLSAWRR